MTREHRAWEMLIRRLDYLNSFAGNRSEMERTMRIVAEIWDDAGHDEEPEDPDFYPVEDIGFENTGEVDMGFNDSDCSYRIRRPSEKLFTNFSKEREKLIADMILYSLFSEHLEKFSVNEICRKLEFFFDKGEIEFVLHSLKEDV